MKQEGHEYIIKKGCGLLSSGEKSNNILNYLAYPEELQVETHTEVNVMEDEAYSVTDSYYATISQHFLPPSVADFLLHNLHPLLSFMSSSPHSSRDGEPLQGV